MLAEGSREQLLVQVHRLALRLGDSGGKQLIEECHGLLWRSFVLILVEGCHSPTPKTSQLCVSRQPRITRLDHTLLTAIAWPET